MNIVAGYILVSVCAGEVWHFTCPGGLEMADVGLKFWEDIFIKIRGFCWGDIYCTQINILGCGYNFFIYFQPQIILSFFHKLYIIFKF